MPTFIRSFLDLSIADISIGDLGIIIICVVAAILLDHLLQFFLNRRPNTSKTTICANTTSSLDRSRSRCTRCS